MPQIRPIPAISFASPNNGSDISTLIAPPYDVLDQSAKDRLLRGDAHNIVTIDLPHLPAKTVGPDETYQKAGQTYRDWLKAGVLVKRQPPALFAYQQTYVVGGKKFQRRGLIANVQIQPFGKSPSGGGKGGIHPHEQTFSGPKEDRMKLMRATKAQLSPIFGMYSDASGRIGTVLNAAFNGPPTLKGTTANDGTLHEIWALDRPAQIEKFAAELREADIFIADGHHRYTTALNYRQQLMDQNGGLAADHPAQNCLFVLISMQDPGMIVLPTHRVLGGMANFSWPKFVEASKGKLNIKPFVGNLAALEKALPTAGAHAIGLFCPSNSGQPLAIATTVQADPLAATHAKQSPAWRELDVAIVQHLIVEGICEPQLCPPEVPGQVPGVQWKFPHTLDEFEADTQSLGFQLGLLLQPTPLDSVRKVSEAGELMPQKSTFFYPKLATGLVINPID